MTRPAQVQFIQDLNATVNCVRGSGRSKTPGTWFASNENDRDRDFNVAYGALR